LPSHSSQRSGVRPRRHPGVPPLAVRITESGHQSSGRTVVATGHRYPTTPRAVGRDVPAPGTPSPRPNHCLAASGTRPAVIGASGSAAVACFPFLRLSMMNCDADPNTQTPMCTAKPRW
jgi:hypothetical protein